MNISYDRTVQWVAGPFAGIVGLLATKAVTHLSFLGAAGLQNSAVAHGIVTGAVFVATALVTFLSHQKWMSNLSKWWEVSGVAAPATAATVASAPVANVQTVRQSPATLNAADRLRLQLKAAGIEPNA